ncbi:putative F-box domain, leucine-rich repeat domain, L domain-containing protein [Rosa chinensis]|uniref:Putative F-box domain, leucine-rich repeat domain, L domain-containing protein n=1 Tax=Rosa chinensis TaxID=74649 RepID=A0A2P6Q5U7_ROSCH|nr:putative F-box/LRR-repeat protein 23 [Rosa chinensis]PRQ29556.1 putative F-box domain, leucine-rich repeat domain, L domain-containing protein [Rosa chinensis]
MSDVPDRRRLLSRSWTEFQDDVMSSILARLGAIEILQTAQKVCTTWRRISKQPSMWRRIDMSNKWSFPSDQPFELDKMCRHAIDRSCGSLVEIKLQNFGNNELLKYITDSSRGIRSLQLVNCYIKDEGFSEVASKLSVLEDLEISVCGGYISHKTVEVVGQACPLLKSFKLNCFRFMLNKQNSRLSLTTRDDLRESLRTCDVEALAISRTMQDLHHLKLVGNRLTNDG